MALTIPPPSAGTVPSFGSFAAIPVAHAEGGRTVIELRGEADLSTRRALSNVMSQVIELGRGDVVIDLTETTFIDTAIVRTLAIGQQLLDRQGSSLIFRSPSRLASMVLQVFGMSYLIEAPEEIQL